MNSTDTNPKITPFLRYFTLVETLVLILAGFGLFLLPKIAVAQWPWPLAPFNTRFLGAIYLGALMPIGWMFLSGRWSPTRPVLRAIFTFTFTVLVVSVITSSLWDFQRVAVWGWFALYAALPLSAGYHLWLYRAMPTDHLNPVSKTWSLVLRGTSLVLVVYGLGLMLMPKFFGGLFPWGLDVFHSQLYSAIFLTGGVMLFTVSKDATPAEFIAAGLTEVTFGTFSILGLVIVDAAVKKVDWSATNTIVWLASLAMMAVLGIVMIAAGMRGTPGEAEG